MKIKLCVYCVIDYAIVPQKLSIYLICLFYSTETALACLTVDPALLLMILGIVMFFITFCGCVGSLRENICLLQTVSKTSCLIRIVTSGQDHFFVCFSDILDGFENITAQFCLICVFKSLKYLTCACYMYCNSIGTFLVRDTVGS